MYKKKKSVLYGNKHLMFTTTLFHLHFLNVPSYGLPHTFKVDFYMFFNETNIT